MPHWSSSPEAGRELEVEYDEALQQYRQLVLDGASVAEQYTFKRSVLTPLAKDLRSAREHWRNFGEAVAAQAVADNQPVPEGGRVFGKVENNREGFEAPGDPTVGDPIWDVTQDPNTGEKTLVGARSKKRSNKSSDEEAQS